MKTIKHSPVSPMDLTERLWLEGNGIETIGTAAEDAKCVAYFVPLDRGYLPGDIPELPLEQHSCCHGSQFVRRHKGALRCCGWAIVVWSLIVFWMAAFAVLGALARWLR